MDVMDRKPEAATSPQGRRWWKAWKVLAAVVIGIGLFFAVRQGSGLVPQALELVEDLGPWAAVAFICIYAVATVAWIPGSILTLASGAIFGLVKGTLVTLTGATLGATLAFLISRYLARGALERRIGNDPRLASMDNAIQRQGGKLVFLIRLSPVFPFNLLNYALGLTAVRLRDYVLASAIGMAPGTFMYVYAGFAAGQVALSASGVEGRGPAGYAVLGVGLLATVVVTVIVTRIARRAISDASPASEAATSGAAGSDPLTETSD